MVSAESFFAAILKTKLVISTSANNDKQKTELRRTLAFNLQFKQNYKYSGIFWQKNNQKPGTDIKTIYNQR
jgi:hypothetical protein